MIKNLESKLYVVMYTTPAAAMMGGVAGNAGLFSDANCLGVFNADVVEWRRVWRQTIFEYGNR